MSVMFSLRTKSSFVLFADGFDKRLGTLFLLVSSPCAVVQVTLSFDSRVLQAVGPSSKLAGDRFGKGHQFGHAVRDLLEVRESFEQS